MTGRLKTHAILLRGAPAVGKTTLALVLKEQLLAQQYRVAMFQWDNFCHLIEPVSMGREEILSATRALVGAIEGMAPGGSETVVIIEGVFAYPEELRMISRLEVNFDIHTFLLTCEPEEQLARNRTRAFEDVLDEGRVLHVRSEMAFWESSPEGKKSLLRGQQVLATDSRAPDFLGRMILGMVMDTNPCTDLTQNKPEIGHCPFSVGRDRYRFVEEHGWCFGQFVRFHGQRLVRIQGETFRFNDRNENKELLCLTPFWPGVGEVELFNGLAALDRKYGSVPIHKVEFHYVDEEHPLFRLAVTEERSQTSFWRIMALWDAPILRLRASDDILSFMERHPRLRRTLTTISTRTDSRTNLELPRSPQTRKQAWEAILKLDRSSWKGRQGSDMASIIREDIAYLPAVIDDFDNCSLMVSRSRTNGELLAWSLFMRSSYGGPWFAVKWGASSDGRKLQAGIQLLIEHLKVLDRDRGKLEVDFWGRNSPIYLQLANATIKRAHIALFRQKEGG